MLNTHNLVIKGLKKASGETCNWSCRSGGYTEIFYNIDTGEVWTVDQVSLGQNSWTVYHDPAIIRVTTTSQKMTMQEIADAIFQAANDHVNEQLIGIPKELMMSPKELML